MTTTARAALPPFARWLTRGLTEPVSLAVDAAYLLRVAAFRIALAAVYAAGLPLTGATLGWRWEAAFLAFVAFNGVAHAIHAAIAIRRGRLVTWIWWFAPFADLAAVAMIMATQPHALALVWGVAIIPLLFFSAAISWRAPYLVLTWLVAAGAFVLGLAVHSTAAERFAPGEIGMGLALLLVGSIVIVRTAVHLRALVHQLESQSLTDALTGLANRRALAEQIHRPDLDDATRERYRVAVFVADVDNFKRVNDVHGHEVGDERLREVADRLRSYIRREDVVYRYGGDEFVVVAPVVSDDEAAVLADRLQDAVHTTTETRISIGFAVAAPGAPDLSQALQWADRALLEAKRRGRGLIVPAAAEPGEPIAAS